MSEPEPVLSPDEAFSLLGNETRVAILQAIWRADGPISFSELREEVGSPDSGKFNYHLKKLSDHYLERTDEGYALRPAGQDVVGAILASAIDRRPRFGSVSVDQPCPLCGGELAAEFDDRGVITCTECDETIISQDFAPAGVANRDDPAILRAFDRWTRHRAELMIEGVCPQCAGEVEHEVTKSDKSSEERSHGYYTKNQCLNCRRRLSAPVTFAVYSHPKVVGFFDDHGVDVEELLYWELAAHTTDTTETVVSEDPWQLAITFPLDDEQLVVTVDESLTVVDTERSARY